MTRNIFIIFLMIGVSTICIASGNVVKSDLSMKSSGEVEKPLEVLYGSWKVVGYEWAGISSNEEKDPKRHVGKTILFFGSDHAQLLGVAAIFCKVPEYNFHYEKNAAKYLMDGFRAWPSEVGTKTTDLNVIDISCVGENNSPGYGQKVTIFVINTNTIIYKTDGPFYRLKKITK